MTLNPTSKPYGVAIQFEEGHKEVDFYKVLALAYSSLARAGCNTNYYYTCSESKLYCFAEVL